jgi:hypothetical protein
MGDTYRRAARRVGVRAQGGLRWGRRGGGGEPDSSSSPGPARGRTKGLTGGPRLSVREKEGGRGSGHGPGACARLGR